MVQTRVQMRSTRINGWSMLKEKMNWEEALKKYLRSISPFLMSKSTTAGIDKTCIPCKIIERLLLPPLLPSMPSNRTSDSAPLPLKNGICHRDFQTDDAEAQRCCHRLMLCRILYFYEFLCSQFVIRMRDLPSLLLSRLCLTKCLTKIAIPIS